MDRFPFEIQEEGWGEFEINIKLFFQDPLEKPVDLFHPLKLYPSDPTTVNLIDYFPLLFRNEGIIYLIDSFIVVIVSLYIWIYGYMDIWI